MNEITKIEQDFPVPAPTALSILDQAVRQGITAENVAVVEKLLNMRREELAAQAKAEFAKAFFAVKKTISGTNFYADKAAKTDSGSIAYVYCSEEEISRMLEPILFSHELCMMFGQRESEGKMTAIVTVLHSAGHQETREYTVRVGATNRMKDATAADAGSTTTAWRHLVIKFFGIKSRIREDSDAKNEGDRSTTVTKDQADELERRCRDLNVVIPAFLKLAHAEKFADIPAVLYDILDAQLSKKERTGR
jgi:ERF superfamily